MKRWDHSACFRPAACYVLSSKLIAKYSQLEQPAKILIKNQKL